MFLKQILLFFLYVNIYTGGCFKLKIFHTNDMHSRFEEVSRTTGVCKPGTECFGGFARVAHFVKSNRNENSLFLNAGDNFQGTSLFTFFGARLVGDMIDKTGIDAMSLGNHEFDLGPNELGEYLSKLNTNTVTCNVHAPDNPNFNYLKKQIIFSFRNIEIGVVGYLTPLTKSISVTGNVTITDEIECIRKHAQDMKRDGVSLVIALGHSGWEKDIEIAEKVEEIDAVVGGHTDTFVYTGTPPDIEVPIGPYPTMVHQPSGKQVPVVQAYGYTKYVGVLNLEFDNTTFKLINASGNPVLMTQNIKQDEYILKALQPYKDNIKDIVKRVVGKTNVDIDGFCRERECNMGDFFTDFGVDYVEAQNITLKTNKYKTIGMVNGGNIRSSVSLSTLNEGHLLYNDLITILPFPGFFDHITLNGSDLMEILQHSLDQYKKGGFLQFANLVVFYPVTKNEGKKITAFALNQQNKAEKIKNDEIYNVVVLDFVYQGGDGFNFTKATLIRSYPEPVLNIFEKAIKQHSPLNIQTHNRIRFDDSENPNADSGSSKLFINFVLYIFTIVYFLR